MPTKFQSDAIIFLWVGDLVGSYNKAPYLIMKWAPGPRLNIITMASQWARWHLKSPASRLFTQPFIQGADQRKHQRFASLAFVRGNHRWPGNSPHKWPVTRNRFLFDDVMTSGDETCNRHSCVAFLQIKRIPFRTNMHRHSVSIWYFAFYIFGWLKACWARTVHSRYPRNILSKYHDRR